LKNGMIHKFNDQELKFNETDDCYHVLAQTDGRTSSSPFFTIMVKPINGHERYDTRVEYRTSRTGPEHVSITLHFEKSDNNQPGKAMATIEQQNRPRKVIEFNGRNPFNQLEHGETLFFVNDHVMSLKIPQIGKIRVQADAVDIEIPQQFKGHLSGMCGNSNLVMKGKELKGVNTCTFTKPSLEVASHRFQMGSCPQLQGSVKAELEKEKKKCQSGHFGAIENETGNGMSHLQEGNSMGMRVSGGEKTGNLGCFPNGKDCRFGNQCCSGNCKYRRFYAVYVYSKYICVWNNHEKIRVRGSNCFQKMYFT